MSAPVPRIVDAFAGLRVLVIGEAMLDCYLQGPATRLCPEAPAPIVDLESRTEHPGGAANAALNAFCLGADVPFLSVVGDDGEGRTLRRALRQEGVDPSGLLVQPGRRTLAKHRVMAESRLVVRFDQGDGDVPEGHHNCLRLVAPGQVVDAAIELLQRGAGDPQNPSNIDMETSGHVHVGN